MAAPEAIDRVLGRSEPWAPFWPRFALQSAARTNRRRHALRHATRLARWHLFDIVGVAAATSLTLAARAMSGNHDLLRWIESPTTGVVFAQCIIAVWSGLAVVRAYEDGDAKNSPSRVAFGVALGLLLLHWSLLWRDGTTVLTSYLPAVALFTACVWSARTLGCHLLEEYVPSVTQPARALMLGRPNDVAAAMLRSPLTGANGLVAVAQLDPAGIATVGAGPLALESTLQTLIHEHDVDTTLLCGQFDDLELSQIVGTAEAAGCRVISMSRTYSVSNLSPKLKTYGRMPVVELTQPGIRGRDVVLKRAFDIVVASAALLLFAPVMLIVALLVKRSSPGPILFRQERVGYRGRRFHIYKFRSMRADAEQKLEELRNENIYSDPRLFKMIDDPRVTPLGHFIRRSSLDELPQLFNVLGGSMSLVGPRPPLLREVASYGDRSYLRFDVKPGITGPWQVNGRNTITSFDEVISLEAAYVSGWTIWRDFAILARTVPVVLRMEGAQ